MNELSLRSGIDSFCRAALGIKTDSLRKQDDGFYDVGQTYCKHLGDLEEFKWFGLRNSRAAPCGEIPFWLDTDTAGCGYFLP